MAISAGLRERRMEWCNSLQHFELKALFTSAVAAPIYLKSLQYSSAGQVDSLVRLTPEFDVGQLGEDLVAVLAHLRGPARTGRRAAVGGDRKAHHAQRLVVGALRHDQQVALLDDRLLDSTIDVVDRADRHAGAAHGRG